MSGKWISVGRREGFKVYSNVEIIPEVGFKNHTTSHSFRESAFLSLTIKFKINFKKATLRTILNRTSACGLESSGSKCDQTACCC